jgi:hypothetical protein
MRRTVLTAWVAVAFVSAGAATARAAASDPVLQSFHINVVNHPGRVVASGIVLNSTGTATPTSPTSYNLTFPGGPGRLTETVTDSVGGIGPGCVQKLSQSGTFTFSYAPTAVLGLVFGGTGTYTQNSFTVYRLLPGGGCDTSALPLLRNATVDAAATRVFAVL